MKTDKFDRLWFDVVENTPLSPVWVAAAESGLVAIEIGGTEEVFLETLAEKCQGPTEKGETRTREIVQQITDYLQQERSAFDLPIDWSLMTEFQEKVLRAVYAIPYGETRSYGQIAAQIGMQAAARAVGRANATNPVPLIIPCHRVIGSDGSLRGYGTGDGIGTKAWLLAMEANAA
jgi:methylated-DNA-[protein]-cysteine S-methyltransferase